MALVVLIIREARADEVVVADEVAAVVVVVVVAVEDGVLSLLTRPCLVLRQTMPSYLYKHTTRTARGHHGLFFFPPSPT